MSIYSSMLARTNQTTTGVFALFTAGSAVTTVIRDIELGVVYGSTPVQGYVLINGVGVIPVGVIPAGTTFQWKGRLVLEPGDVVAFDCTAGSNWSIWASGYELS